LVPSEVPKYLLELLRVFLSFQLILFKFTLLKEVQIVEVSDDQFTGVIGVLVVEAFEDHEHVGVFFQSPF